MSLTTMKKILSVAAAAGLAVLPAMGAMAQTAPGAPGTSETIPEKVQPNAGAGATEGRSSGGNLSDKLDKSNGVIQAPQSVDPSITKPAPGDSSTMPVITPPANSQAK